MNILLSCFHCFAAESVECHCGSGTSGVKTQQVSSQECYLLSVPSQYQRQEW